MRKITIGLLSVFLLVLMVGCPPDQKGRQPGPSDGISLPPTIVSTDNTTTSTVELSSNIGANLPRGYNITYEGGFVPIISRDKAISIARTWLHEHFLRNRYVNIVAENYPINATVALYSGPNGPPTYETLIGVQVWVAVITGLPYTGSGGPIDPRPFKFIVQANVIIDAKTGVIVYGSDTAQKVYLDEPITEAGPPGLPAPNGTSNQTFYTLAVTVSPLGSGLVSPSRGKYASGTQVSLIATPSSGYVLSGWESVDRNGVTRGFGALTSNNRTLNLTMDSDLNVTARFTAAPQPPWGNVTVYTYINANLTLDTVAGQEFAIGLPYTSRVTADWSASFNESTVALVDTEIIRSGPLPSGLKWFLFKALKSGRTEITMRYGNQAIGAFAEQRIYSVNIK